MEEPSYRSLPGPSAFELAWKVIVVPSKLAGVSIARKETPDGHANATELAPLGMTTEVIVTFCDILTEYLNNVVHDRKPED
jgi:hypothetical protein